MADADASLPSEDRMRSDYERWRSGTRFRDDPCYSWECMDNSTRRYWEGLYKMAPSERAKATRSAS